MTTAPAKPLHRSALESQVFQAQKDLLGLLGDGNELVRRIRREEVSLRAACRFAKARAEQCDAAFEFEVARLKDTIEKQRRKLRIDGGAHRQHQHQQHQRNSFAVSFGRALRKATARLGGASSLLGQQTPAHGEEWTQVQARGDGEEQGMMHNGNNLTSTSNNPHLKLIDGVVHMSLVRKGFRGRKTSQRKKKVKVKMAFGRPVPDGFHIKKTHDVSTHHRRLGHNRQATFLDSLRNTRDKPKKRGGKSKGKNKKRAGVASNLHEGGDQDHAWVKPERPLRRPFLSPKSQTSLFGAASGGAEPYHTLQETRNRKYGAQRKRLSSSQILHKQMTESARAHAHDLQSSLRSHSSSASTERKPHVEVTWSSSPSRARIRRHKRSISKTSSANGDHGGGDGVGEVDKASQLRLRSKLIMRKLRR